MLAIGHATGNLFSEDGRRIFTCTRQSLGGGRCPWDSETDNHVHVDLGIRRKPEVGERLVGAPLQALIHKTGISPPDGTLQTSLTASVESGMRLFWLNLLGLILLPQDFFLELKAASVSIANVT
ncbi:hypothetical protein JJB98_28090 [Bradyrhizobium diazoefficiens]|nr:hypothetical protein [Bradyrhizobium diazoefficiens]QQO23518.1 hypothetical protein JJB98_28090 [Bradyrhizobium diazoefficiens]